MVKKGTIYIVTFVIIKHNWKIWCGFLILDRLVFNKIKQGDYIVMIHTLDLSTISDNLLILSSKISISCWRLSLSFPALFSWTWSISICSCCLSIWVSTFSLSVSTCKTCLWKVQNFGWWMAKDTNITHHVIFMVVCFWIRIISYSSHHHQHLSYDK